MTVYQILKRLEAAQVYFTLGRIREDTIVIFATVPGERWEIEILESGEVETEIFRTTGMEVGSEYICGKIDQQAAFNSDSNS